MTASRISLRLLLLSAWLVMAAASVSAFLGHLFGDIGEHLLEEALATTTPVGHERLMTAGIMLQRARTMAPWDPSRASAEGQWLQAQASEQSVDSAAYHLLMQQARDAYGVAVRLHPLNAEYQLFAGWAESLVGSPSAGKRAIRTALHLYPKHPWIWFEATRWYLARWNTLDASDRAHAIELVHVGAPHEPRRYLDLCWDALQDPELIRRILPDDPAVREQLMRDLTDRLHFAHRWAEGAAHPQLSSPADDGAAVIRVGVLPADVDLRSPATLQAITWEGAHDGWLHGRGMARAEVPLPRGEALLIIQMTGEAAAGEPPTVYLQIEDHGLGYWTIEPENATPLYALIRAPGGRTALKVFLTNGAMVHEQGAFTERRVKVDAVHIITPPRV